MGASGATEEDEDEVANLVEREITRFQLEMLSTISKDVSGGRKKSKLLNELFKKIDKEGGDSH